MDLRLRANVMKVFMDAKFYNFNEPFMKTLLIWRQKLKVLHKPGNEFIN